MSISVVRRTCFSVDGWELVLYSFALTICFVFVNSHLHLRYQISRFMFPLVLLRNSKTGHVESGYIAIPRSTVQIDSSALMNVKIKMSNDNRERCFPPLSALELITT